MKNCFNATLITFIFIVIFQLPFNTRAQYGFEKYFGNQGANNNGFGLVQTTDGGFILCGSSDNNALMIKTDQHGDEMWHQDFTDGNMECIRLVSDGGYITAGTNYSSPYSGVFRKTDSLGNEVWNYQINSGAFSHYGISAMQMQDGHFVFLENDTYPFQEYMRVWKVDSGSRATQWTTEINKVSNCSPGALIQTIDSGIVVTCGDFTTAFPHLILAKLHPDSLLEWKKDYGYPGTINAGLAGNTVIQTNDSNFLVMGYKVTGSLQSDFSLFLMKVNASGDSLWSKTYIMRNSNDFPSVIQTQDGGFALVSTVAYPPSGGNFDYRIVLMKTNSTGDSLWSKEFMGLGLNQAHQLIQCNDGGYAILGTSTDQNIGENYFYLIKTDSTGDILNSANAWIDQEKNLLHFPGLLTNQENISIDIPDRFGKGNYRVFDLSGRMSAKGNLTEGRNSISTQALSNGIFFIQFEFKNYHDFRKFCTLKE
ncbi:MAG TPA: hypothetical protein PKL85_11425 [Bacteroidia bacterium]|nr:hypothetical protein [Bacteroidia bacterium]